MKTKMPGMWMAAFACIGTLTTVPSFANEQAAAAKNESSYTGTIVSVQPDQHLLHVKWLLVNKKFNLGNNCEYVLPDNATGGISDLRAGEKVKVSYQNAHGVLVADQVQQIPMTYQGTVKAVDPTTKTLTLDVPGSDKTFQVPDDCKITLHNKTGAIDRVQPGNTVTVVYEMPNGKLVAREILQASAMFTGAVTAIDANNRIVTAKGTFGSKQFNIGDGCSFVVNGGMNGQLNDLKIGQRLEFSYDNIDGVNVANRIGSTQSSSQTTSAPIMEP